MNSRIREVLTESILIKQALLGDEALLKRLDEVAMVSTIALKGGKKILFCGNGGSAADAQHLAGELSGRYYLERAPLYAEALHVNTSTLTAISNDYSYEMAYARILQSKAQAGDILFALSTSGNSPNILKAIDMARQQMMIVVGMTGASAGKMKDRCDYLLQVPSKDVPRVQEAHILLGHIICELVEQQVFGKPQP